MLSRDCAQSRQARKDFAANSSFPPFVISVIFVVNPTRAIPLATLRLCEKPPHQPPLSIQASAQRRQARQDF
jgi:hypothetical protein